MDRQLSPSTDSLTIIISHIDHGRGCKEAGSWDKEASVVSEISLIGLSRIISIPWFRLSAVGCGEDILRCFPVCAHEDLENPPLWWYRVIKKIYIPTLLLLASFDKL
jgi:hypothetical protein